MSRSSSPPPSSAPAAAAPAVRRIIKLGGAAITIKSQPETLRPDVLRRVCSGLVEGAAQPTRAGTTLPAGGGPSAPCCDTVVVHGAGSFGHHTAAEYGVAGGDLADPRVRKGFALTRQSVSRLHAHVVDTLVEAGAPAVSLPPFPLYTLNGKDKQIPAACSAAAASAVRRCLASGLLPVLHGDAVTVTAEGAVEGPVEGEGGLQGTLAPGPSAHGTQGRKAGVQGGEATAGARAAAAGAGPGPGGSGVVRSGILSGDTLVRDLAASLGPQYVVFLTNVDGVYDRPPEEEGARLLRRIVVQPGGGWRAEAWDEWEARQQQQQLSVTATGSGRESPAGVAAPAPGPTSASIRTNAAAHDVTGGISLKVAEAAAVALAGVPVLIARAGSEAGAEACSRGPGVLGEGEGGGGWRGTLVVAEV